MYVAVGDKREQGPSATSLEGINVLGANGRYDAARKARSLLTLAATELQYELHNDRRNLQR
jgi:hypothetical protein